MIGEMLDVNEAMNIKLPVKRFPQHGSILRVKCWILVSCPVKNGLFDRE